MSCFFMARLSPHSFCWSPSQIKQLAKATAKSPRGTMAGLLTLPTPQLVGIKRHILKDLLNQRKKQRAEQQHGQAAPMTTTTSLSSLRRTMLGQDRCDQGLRGTEARCAVGRAVKTGEWKRGNDEAITAHVVSDEACLTPPAAIRTLASTTLSASTGKARNAQ
jgi:hypothetical protein